MPRRRATPARGLRRPTLPAPPHLAPGALTLDPLAASSYCAGARAPRPPRLRLGLWLGPPCCRPPARPPSGTGRPAPPADPPRGRGPHHQPQGGGGGASRAPDTTNPAGAARLREAAGIGRRLVRAVKGAAARRTGEKRPPRGTARYLAESQGAEQRVSLSQ